MEKETIVLYSLIKRNPIYKKYGMLSGVSRRIINNGHG
jgi:hypothetical protein